jgi:hypothetical protein
MFNQTKLKGPLGRKIPFAILTIFICIFTEIYFAGFPFYSIWGFGFFFIILGIVDFYRTKLYTYLIVFLLAGTATWHSNANFDHIYGIENDSIFSQVTYVFHVIFNLIYIAFSWSILYSHEKLEANARRLFKLASELIFETSDGFTNRPYSAGTAEYSREEILGFARFLNGKNIIRSVTKQDSVILTFSMGISPLKYPALTSISYVTFDYEGKISVHISKYDYKRYKEKLKFNELCDSLANVFKRFLTYYQNGNDDRIITELKSMR